MADAAARWLDYDFQVFSGPPGSVRWNEVPGLYIFATLVKNRQGARQWRALYVGKTQDFSDRLPTHENWPEAAQLGATHIHARVVNQAADRTRLECLIWNKYSPVLNEKSPEGCRELLERMRGAKSSRS